jgi:excisionase family DNA binding protein
METLRSSETPGDDAFPAKPTLVLPEKLLTVREVAAQLRVCRATVYKMADRGDLPHVRIAGAVRIHPADLAAAVERLRHE